MISAINVINTSKNNYVAPKSQQRLSFKAHPDFDKLNKVYDVTASSFFRRGSFYGAPSAYYVDIVETFKKIFLPEKLTSKKKMLIVGIGDSQEPFSYLATIRSLAKEKPLADTVEMHTIDLQSKPNSIKLKKDSFFEYPSEPEFAKTSFVPEVRKDHLGKIEYYRVNDEILDFVEEAYGNPQKSQWERRLQEALPEYKPETFDVISINNTLGYIKDDQIRFQAVRDAFKALKLGGTYISDPFGDIRLAHAGVKDSLEVFREGVYRKISNEIKVSKEINK